VLRGLRGVVLDPWVLAGEVQLLAGGELDLVRLDGGREFIAFWLNGTRVLAGMNVKVWDVTDPIKALINSQTPVDLAKLTDASWPLERLAAQCDLAALRSGL
jgi:hypothetical protein